MNTETINQLKNEYKDFLFTELGQDLLKHAVILKKKWGHVENRVTQQSKFVKKQLLPKEIQDRMTFIKIIPIGLNNACHNNTEFFANHGFKCRTGYNMFACECGKNISFEEHSVNEKNGVLYDFTKDFNNENEKWFLELKTENSYRQLKYLFGYKNKYIDLGCKCNVGWNMEGNKITTDKMLQEIENKEQIRIIGL